MDKMPYATMCFTKKSHPSPGCLPIDSAAPILVSSYSKQRKAIRPALEVVLAVPVEHEKMARSMS